MFATAKIAWKFRIENWDSRDDHAAERGTVPQSLVHLADHNPTAGTSG